MKKSTACPSCGEVVYEWVNPTPTVDIIIEVEDASPPYQVGDAGGVDLSRKHKKIVLIERKNEPHGWALPGGYVDYGETLEKAAIREAKEETGLDVKLVRQLHSYSDPARDPRQHNVSTVFAATATGAPKAGDDAANIALFTKNNLPPLVFDHDQILDDYFNGRY